MQAGQPTEGVGGLLQFLGRDRQAVTGGLRGQVSLHRNLFQQRAELTAEVQVFENVPQREG